MSRPLAVADIAAMLAARALSLCAELLPQGVRDGAEWRVGSVAGERGRSLAVRLSGERVGLWADFATDDRGDALDLVAGVRFGGDKVRAIRWSRAWLGLDAIDPCAIETHRRAAAAKEADAQRDEHRREASALRLFLGCDEKLAGTPAERYLAGRGIELARLGRQPRALRFHPQLFNRESGRAWPALVAAIHGGGTRDRLVAVHRTWLETLAGGIVGKAPLRDPKMTLGRYAGGSIRLWRGSSAKPLRDAPAGSWVVVAEGIEDALSAAMATPDRRCLAAVSLANLGSLRLPRAVEGVILLAQNDPTGSPAAAALDRAIRSFHAQGLQVRVARPPARYKDINDMLRAGAA